MASTVRPRWSVVLFTGLTVALVLGTPAHLKTHAWLGPSLYGIGVFGGPIAYGIRRRTLTPTDEGLWIYRSYFDQMFCSWGEVLRVERRRMGPFSTDQLVLREPVRKLIKSDGRSPAEIVWKPTRSKRILIGLYDKRWRSGPTGAALTARGVSLDATEPPDPTASSD